MGRILAIDYGLKRVGIAVSDELQMIATPLITIATNDLLSWINDYVQVNNVSAIVVGYPLRTKTSDNSIISYVDGFVTRCRKMLSNEIVISVFDERYTSIIAHQTVINSQAKKNKRQDKSIYDKIAACILLQDYLNYIKS